MLKSADIGKLDDLPEFWRLDGSRVRTVHVQRAVNPPLMVGVEVACKDSFEVAFVEDSHMVKALAADGPDEALDIGRLPRGVWCNQDLLDAEAVHSGPEWSAVCAIAVAEEVEGSCVEREGLHDLLGSPLAGGIRGYVEVQNLASMMGEDQEDEQDPETDGGDRDEIDGHQILDVVIQEDPPSR